MNYPDLKDEVINDPLGRGYAALDHAATAADLNVVYRSVEREVVEAWEIFEAVVPSEYAALSASDKRFLGQVLAMGNVNIRGSNTRSALGGMFGPGTATRSNLIILQTETVSRARELGLGFVRGSEVAEARRIV